MHLRTRVLAPYRIRPPSHAEAWNGEAINNQYTQLGTCILGPILSAAHTRSPISIVSVDCKIAAIARAVLSMRMHTPPACLNCKMLVCYFGLSNGGLGAILCMHSPRQMRAVWSSRLLRLLAKQQLAAAHAYVYALAIQRWQHNPAPATAPQPIRINPGSMTAMNTFAKQRGPKNNKNHSPACLHVCWQRLKNTKKHQKTPWAAKTNLKKPEEDMFCSDAKTP